MDNNQIDNSSRHSKEQAVDAVEYAPMTWYQVAGIFHVGSAFHQRFCQIAQGACYRNHQAQSGKEQWLRTVEKGVEIAAHHIAHCHCEHQSAPKAFPRFFG